MIDINKVVEMRVNGATIEAIGKKFNVSKQYISQELQKFVGVSPKNNKTNLNGIIYPEISKYMGEHGLSFIKFGKSVGVTNALISKKLRGECALTKRDIDNIIKVTGMTYETLFLEEETPCQQQ